MSKAIRTILVSMILIGLARGPQAQVIRLRHPEASSQQLPVGQLASGKTNRPAQQAGAPIDSGGGRQRAKPGNLIVHFDASHEIERVEYKLKDGSLATIFTRGDKLRPAGKTKDSLELNDGKSGRPEGDADDDDNETTPKSTPKSETGEILSHVAADALRPHLTMRTAKSLADSIKANLAKVPGLIRARLQAKSLRGNAFIDARPEAGRDRDGENAN